jgi:hypothetical protein
MWALWTAHYKKYRPILMADSVHVTRPGQNGRAIEATLHVEPRSRAGFANLFNPKPRAVTKPIRLPMYYAGLGRGETVQLTWGGSLVNPGAWPVPTGTTATVEDDYTLRITVAMAPHSFLWLSIESATATREADERSDERGP